MAEGGKNHPFQPFLATFSLPLARKPPSRDENFSSSIETRMNVAFSSLKGEIFHHLEDNKKENLEENENSAITITIHVRKQQKNSLESEKKVKVIENLQEGTFDPISSELDSTIHFH